MKILFGCFHSSYENSEEQRGFKDYRTKFRVSKKFSRAFSTSDGLGWNDSFDYECRRLSKVLDDPSKSESLVRVSNCKEPSAKKLTRQSSFFKLIPKIHLDGSSKMESAKSMVSLINEQLSFGRFNSEESDRKISFDLQSKISNFTFSSAFDAMGTKLSPVFSRPFSKCAVDAFVRICTTLYFKFQL